MTTLVLDDIEVDVIYKDIKNVHLSVHPPTGRVRISAPTSTSPDAVRAFAISKLAWIRRHQRVLVQQEREPPREYIDRESHYAWGRRYLLVVSEVNAPPQVELSHSKLLLSVRPGSDTAARSAIMSQWYRDQVRAAAVPVIAQWEAALDVKLAGFQVRRMKTMWGSCSHDSATIRLNTELAKKPPECLDYVALHELAHLVEPTHNQRFIGLLDQHMPNWRVVRDRLNGLQVPMRQPHV